MNGEATYNINALLDDGRGRAAIRLTLARDEELDSIIGYDGVPDLKGYWHWTAAQCYAVYAALIALHDELTERLHGGIGLTMSALSYPVRHG